MLADLMNGIAVEVRRRVDFIHIPVPKTADDAFFEPLQGMAQARGTPTSISACSNSTIPPATSAAIEAASGS